MDRVLAALRPEPHRGDTVAAGVVALTTALFLLQVRFVEAWGTGVKLVLFLIALSAVKLMAISAPMEGERPRAYQSVLYVATYALAIGFLINLADAFGADGASSGTLVWVGLLLLILAGWFAVRRNSAIMTLLAALTFGVVLLALVDWAFDPDGVNTFRWILLLLIAGFVVASVHQRGQRPRHSVQFVNAAGVAAAVLGLTTIAATFQSALTTSLGAGGNASGGTGWELVLVACGFGLLAYAAIDREPGPAYLGVLVLAFFVLSAGFPDADGASLIGWPILLLIGAGALLAAGLRPSRPLPPAPHSGPTEPPPPTPLRAEPPDPPTTQAPAVDPPTDRLDPPTEEQLP